MDGRGGCCIARYDGGGTYDTSKIDRIMLRFRPIAPKPAVSGSVSGETTPEKTDNFIRTGRAKRRYVKDTTNNSSSSKRCCRKRKVAPAEEEKKDTVVTLSLLPEQPDRKEESPTTRGGGGYSPSDHQVDLTAPIWSKSSDIINRGQTSSPESSGGLSSDLTATVVMPQPVRPVGSCVVVVGCVTETYMDGDQELGLGGLGSTDEEKRSNLEMDTCPGIISDGLNRVRWTNEAYRRLVNQDGVVVGGGGGADEAIRRRPEMVWLVMKEEAGGLMMRMRCKAFACRVRLQYTCKKEMNSLIVPCDVWKMDGGGYAWRLDVKAALSLGR